MSITVIADMDKQEIAGWMVCWDAPTLIILSNFGHIMFYTDDWHPNMSGPKEDALSWASAIADDDSGLTIDYDDDPAFGIAVRRVRDLCPPNFADDCASMAQDIADTLI